MSYLYSILKYIKESYSYIIVLIVYGSIFDEIKRENMFKILTLPDVRKMTTEEFESYCNRIRERAKDPKVKENYRLFNQTIKDEKNI
jgi:hypothetical protein